MKLKSLFYFYKKIFFIIILFYFKINLYLQICYYSIKSYSIQIPKFLFKASSITMDFNFSLYDTPSPHLIAYAINLLSHLLNQNKQIAKVCFMNFINLKYF